MDHASRLLATLGVALLPTLPAQQHDDVRVLTASLERFAADLHAELATSANPTFSPASVGLALLMLLPGARGDTATELAAVLHLPTELRGERLHAAAAELLRRTLPAPRDDGENAAPALQIVNDLWCQQGHAFVADYTALLRDRFGAQAHTVDFAGDAEAVRARINRHIAAATQQRITDLLPPAAVQTATRMVLTDAIRYSGRWRHDFYRPAERAPFHVTPEREVAASMMHLTAGLVYADAEAWQAVALPFTDHAIVFELAVPRPGHDLAAAERALLRDELAASRRLESVQVSMPAFRIRTGPALRRPLQALGMRLAFAPTLADFAGIDAEQPLHVGQVFHATDITVDENGVEATAATAVAMLEGAVHAQPRTLHADRPFAFALRDRRTGLLLFLGRVTDPTVES